MPANPKTPEQYRALVARLAKLAPACKSTDAQLWKFIDALRAAMRERDATTIQLELRAVAVETNKVRDLLRQLDEALAALAEIEKDDEFVVAEHQKLVVLARELNRWRGDQSLNLDNATRALADGKAAAQEAARDFQAATRALATLDELATKFRDAALARGKVVDLHLAAARKAAAAHEREAFKKSIGQAQVQAQTLRGDARTFLKGHATRLADFAKDFGKEKLADPLARSAVQAAAAVEAEAVRVELAVGKAADLAPPPIDPYKAAKALGIDKQVARVKKALDGARDDIADQLQALSRDLGLGRSGKQLVEDLRKARVL